MDYLTIDNLSIQATHGHYEQERHVEQEFVVSLKAGIDARTAAQTDLLTDTVDYDDLRKIIEDVFKGKTHYLIEALAEEIIQKIFVETPVQEVTLSIKKTAVWPNGVPGILTTKKRSS